MALPNASPHIEIGELSLRVSGMGPEAARAFGERVGRTVAERLAAGGVSTDLGALRLRLTMTPSHMTAERVADAIVRAVGQRNT